MYLLHPNSWRALLFAIRRQRYNVPPGAILTESSIPILTEAGLYLIIE